MDDKISLYIDKIEQLAQSVPPSFQKMKNQLLCKDYAIAETLRTNKGEIDCYYDFFSNNEINHYLELLKARITELKLEKEQKKLNEKLQNE